MGLETTAVLEHCVQSMALAEHERFNDSLMPLRTK